MRNIQNFRNERFLYFTILRENADRNIYIRKMKGNFVALFSYNIRRLTVNKKNIPNLSLKFRQVELINVNVKSR